MKGYIYTMFAGADPGQGWHMTDPIFGKVPTVGACMPNIRRLVVAGDYIFVISGRVPRVRQYVVGGFKVSEKIDALAAYKRFPNNRLKELKDGSLSGNIIVNADGTQSELDYHGNFEKRVGGYIVGQDPISLDQPHEVEIARDQTLELLRRIFQRKGKLVSDVIGRWRKLDPNQIEEILLWLRNLKRPLVAR
jgi:hypothetical protein